MVEFIREHNPNVKIVVGGPLVNNHARNYHGDALKTALEDMGETFTCSKVRESSRSHGCSNVSRMAEILDDVPNLAYYEGRELHRTTTVPENNRSMRTSSTGKTSAAAEISARRFNTRQRAVARSSVHSANTHHARAL